MRLTYPLLALSLALCATPPVIRAAGPHWGYTGAESPEHWGELAPEYRACSEGRNQSPINIVGTIDAELPPLRFSYTNHAGDILNNGHTIQADFPPGNFIEVDGNRFELKQIHFHTPSENQVLSVSYPMEGHLVHADAAGNLAVVGVMMSEGAENSALAKLWTQLPKHEGERTPLAAQVSATDFLPANRDYYRFGGSLTTPPCSEGVRWLLMKNAVTVSADQVETFAHLMHHPNNRPVQPVNARPVLR